jgi:hypothetical protein
MSYIILRGRWCDIIILNVHAPTEDKIDDMKDRFYEPLGRPRRRWVDNIKMDLKRDRMG